MHSLAFAPAFSVHESSRSMNHPECALLQKHVGTVPVQFGKI